MTKKCKYKTYICFGKGRKHCGKKRKCWLPAFSPFPIMFSKGYVKSWDCWYRVKGLNPLLLQGLTNLKNQQANP